MNSITSSLKTIRVVAAVIERGGCYLITQRRATAVLPLLWEFPGGRVEEGESDEGALRREVLHRLGAEIVVNTLISFATHSYEGYCVDLHLYECVLVGDTVTPRMVNDFRWVRSEDFDKYPFTPADEASMSRLLGES
jgi:8-oxo-dGTP diphosphatase